MATDEWHPVSEELIWRGVKIDVRYNPAALGGTWSAHLALHVVDPAPQPVRQTTGGGREFFLSSSDALPVTTTGYRSHFLKPAEVQAKGGPAAFVSWWLDAEAATNRAWAARQPKPGDQLDLFAGVG